MRRFPFYSLIASALSLWVFGILFGNWEENVGNLGSNVFGMFGLNVGLRPTSPILYTFPPTLSSAPELWGFGIFIFRRCEKILFRFLGQALPHLSS
jgi:hypothetical protein